MFNRVRNWKKNNSKRKPGAAVAGQVRGQAAAIMRKAHQRMQAQMLTNR